MKIRCVMPQPKHGNNHSLARLHETIFNYCGGLEEAYGPLWNVAMERAVATQLERGCDWVLCMDSDSTVVIEQLRKLEQTLNDEMEALAPWQPHRGEDRPLWHTPVEEPDPDKPFRVEFSHLGCTFIRAAFLKKMKRPWFRHPDHFKDDEGFWANFIQQGGRLWADPTTNIGHMEEMVRTYRPDKDWAIETQRLADWVG